MPVHIWLDADGCPNEIKRVVFRAAERLEVEAVVVANVPLQMPDRPFVSSALVSHHFDAADDHIAESVGAADVVITADVPLAAGWSSGAPWPLTRGDRSTTSAPWASGWPRGT